MSEEKPLPFKQASELSGLSEWTLRRLANDGVLPSVKINRKVVLVLLSDIQRLIAERRSAKRAR